MFNRKRFKGLDSDGNPLPSMSCENCGMVGRGLLKGEDISSAVLKGLVFECWQIAGEWVAEPKEEGARVFQKMNTALWKREIRDLLELEGAYALSCEKCGLILCPLPE